MKINFSLPLLRVYYSKFMRRPLLFIIIFLICTLFFGLFWKKNYQQRGGSLPPPLQTREHTSRLPLKINWQGKSYVAAKGIYFGEDVESLEFVEGSFQIYKRRGDKDTDSILLKIDNGQYQIFVTDNGSNP